MPITLTDDERRYFRDKLREARSVALRDAEGFHELLFALEGLGSKLAGKIHSFKTYKKALLKLANESAFSTAIPEQQLGFHPTAETLFGLVMQARNDAFHQGAIARHLTANATRLSLILEDALMSGGNRVQDFMVTNPICAQGWQPVSFVRQIMLENSFSFLPTYLEDEGHKKWYLLSDSSLASYLRNDKQGRNDRNDRLIQSIDIIVKGDRSFVRSAKQVRPEDTINTVLSDFDGNPVLVTQEPDSKQLLGILTAFDLL